MATLASQKHSGLRFKASSSSRIIFPKTVDVREGTSCRDSGVDCVPKKTECSGYKEFRVVGECRIKKKRKPKPKAETSSFCSWVVRKWCPSLANDKTDQDCDSDDEEVFLDGDVCQPYLFRY